jgi:hypothetical protein
MVVLLLLERRLLPGPAGERVPEIQEVIAAGVEAALVFRTRRLAAPNDN